MCAFCVGTGNETYATNITIGTAIGNVYQLVDEIGDLANIVADATLCVPMVMSTQPGNHFGGDRFHDISVFYSIVDNVDDFPALPTACTSEKVSSSPSSKRFEAPNFLKSWNYNF